MSRAIGLLSPLQRDGKTDFAHGTGKALTISRVRQVFSTLGSSPLGPGELLWNTDFGCALDTLRHAKRDATTAALARSYVQQAFTRWLPDLVLSEVKVDLTARYIKLTIFFSDSVGTHDLNLNLGGAIDSST